MDVTLRINRASTHPVEVMVEHQGETAKAVMPELEVEMYDETGQHGTCTLHFRKQSEIAAAREVFVQGNEVTMTFAAKAPAAIETTADAAA